MIAKAAASKTPPEGGVLEFGASNEVRTRDLNLGKVALYQLSYTRKTYFVLGSGVCLNCEAHFTDSCC